MTKRSLLLRIFTMSGARLCVLVVCLLSSLRALLGVWHALLFRDLIDSAVGGDGRRFWFFVAVNIGLAVVQLLLQSFSSYMREQTTSRMRVNYHRALYQLCLTRSYPEISAYHTGDLMHRMGEDVNTVIRSQLHMIPDLISYIVQMGGAVIVLIGVDYRFTLVYLALAAVIFTPARLIYGRMKQLRRATLSTDANVRKGIQESLTALAELRSFAVERILMRRTEQRQEAYLNAATDQHRFSMFTSLGIHAFMRGGNLFGLIWCCVGILNGTISFGTLTAVQHLVGKVQTPITGFSGMFTRFAALVASAERIAQIMDLPNEEKHLTNEQMLALRDSFSSLTLKDVGFTYPAPEGAERETVLRHFSMTLRRGECIGIVGESGAGKSTLFKLLLGLYPPEEGRMSAELGGKEIALGCDTRPLFAYVPQMPTLFSGTVRENLTLLNPDVTEEKIKDALDLACCDFLGDLPDGLDTVLSENGAGLSQGQLQRLAIARALLSGAPILLMDEATSALDAQTEDLLIDHLRSVDGLCGIFITHRPNLLSLCGKILRIE